MTTARVEYEVGAYDAQRDGMALVSGWQVTAQVVMPSRKLVSVLIAICPEKDDAEDIASMLNEKYGRPA